MTDMPPIESKKAQVRSLMQAGQHEHARQQCQSLCSDHPRDAEAWFLLGTINGVMGHVEEAERILTRLTQMAPAVAIAHYNLGLILMQRGKPDEAESSFRRALVLDPSSAAIHTDLGNSLKVLGKRTEAIACYQDAISRDPAYAGAWDGLGSVYHDRGETRLARDAYRKAIDLRRARGERLDGALIRLAMTLPVILESPEHLARVRGELERELDALGEQSLHVVRPEIEIGSANFLLAYHGANNRDIKIRMARLIAHACPDLEWAAPFCARYRPPATGERRIRVGFISKYFKNHSVGRTSRGIIAHLSRETFEVYSIFLDPPRDELGRFIESHSDRAVVVPSSLEGARRVIAGLGLDILFYQDIGMDYFTFYLAFSRLAPVQCVSFGHPETTGIPNLDFYISTDAWEPEGAEDHYSERLVRLRNVASVAYYFAPALPEKWKRRADFGIRDDAHLYLCPQALFKFHPDFDDLLAAILRQDPEGELALIHGADLSWGELLTERFRRRLPDVCHRIRFFPQMQTDDYLSLIKSADVMLDTIHFCGFNTSLEAFAVGTPVVTLPGAYMRGRHTAALYRKMGYEACIAGDPDNYVEIAIRLATDRAARQAASHAIETRRAVLWEEIEVVREFERCFLNMVATLHKGDAATRPR